MWGIFGVIGRKTIASLTVIADIVLLSGAAVLAEDKGLFDFPPLLAEGPVGDIAGKIVGIPGEVFRAEAVRNDLGPAPPPRGDDPGEYHGLIPPARNTGEYWHIFKTAWDSDDERGYQAFVTAIGRSDCGSLNQCIKDEANPYRHLDKGHAYHGDCADMTYFLRGYYAWKNGLPFTYQHVMATAGDAGGDIRFSPDGNVVIDRRVVTAPTTGQPIHAPTFLKRIGGEVSTAMFRTHPEPRGSNTHDDFYPLKISRDHVVPGSVAYDVFGHVGLIYEVTEDGRALIVSSHPDNTVTRATYGPNFLRTGPQHGGGIKGWRPIRLVGATETEHGTFVGGRIEATNNDDLAGYSLVQYFGNGEHPVSDWKLSEFVWNGRTMNYYDYVRHALAAEDHEFDPVFEMRTAVKSLCSDIRSRRVAVDQAIQEGIHREPHPGRLPPNIYGTYGTWEAYSTPSRDARLKTGFRDLMRVANRLVEEAGREGPQLAASLLHTYETEGAACRIAYKRMDGSLVRIDLHDVSERLFDLSFDPYHCPERRWGASDLELSTCEETPVKRDWYEAERYLRNQVDRTYDVQMAFSLEELKSPDEAPPVLGGIGQATPPDVDVARWLESVADPHAVKTLMADAATADSLRREQGADRAGGTGGAAISSGGN